MTFDDRLALKRLVVRLAAGRSYVAVHQFIAMCIALNDHVSTSSIEPEDLHPEFLNILCDEDMWDYIYDASKRQSNSHDEAPVRVISEDFQKLHRNRQIFKEGAAA